MFHSLLKNQTRSTFINAAASLATLWLATTHAHADPNTVQVLEGLTFDVGKATFKNDLSPHHINMVRDIYKDGCETILVAGHTDSQGSEALNMAISFARARTVKQTLIEKGFNPIFITIAGHGEENPIASNLTAEGAEKNRRVTVECQTKKQENDVFTPAP